MNFIFWKALALLSGLMIIVSLYYGKNNSVFYFGITLLLSILFVPKK